MSNFASIFLLGKEGKNIGRSTGLAALDKALNGIQKKSSIGIAAAPKCGKTTFADFAYVLGPYLEALKKNTLDNITWIYFSFEIDRVSKEFKFAAFFMYHDYGIFDFIYKGVTYGMSQDYLMGQLMHKNLDGTLEQVPITEEHEAQLKEIYINRIVPLFGDYDSTGKKLSQGKIDFIDDPENPTGLYKYLVRYAKKNGTFLTEDYGTLDDTGRSVIKQRTVGYTEKNTDLMTIVVLDHLRKLPLERGFTMKQNMDKYLEYTTILRNRCFFTFVTICHSGRQLANIDRLKYAGEFVYPTGDDVKDTGNLSEESTILLTLFNPNDEKYNLKKHFDVELDNYPNYRSVHVADARFVPCPTHIQLNMYGGVNLFTPLL